VVVVRVQTDFGGVLPDLRRVQTSRLDPRTLASLAYAEGDGRGKAVFETTFDRRTGLVTLRQGKDEATAPLTTDYHDPVGLLLWLRARAAAQGGGPERSYAHLTGGRVLIQRLPDSQIGDADVHGYYLRPGNAYVYVEREAPHRLTRLIQPTDFGIVEANAQAARRPAANERRRRRGRD
jgi:hypothetical protein